MRESRSGLKVFYQYWRPVTGIRESDAGTGRRFLGDGNPATIGDPTFRRSERRQAILLGQNFHAAVSILPSGHAGSVARCLRRA